MRRAQRYLKTASIYITLFITSLFFIYPWLWMISTGLRKRTPLTPTLWDPSIPATIENFIYVINKFWFLPILYNSIIACLGSTALALLLGIPAGYALARYNFPRKKDIGFYYLSMRFAPAIATLIPIYIMYNYIGLWDTHIGLILIYALFNVALVVWLTRSYFLDIPLEIEESALVDGCSRTGAFLRIALPLAAPGIAATAILCVIFTWNEFLLATILAGRVARTLPTTVYRFFSQVALSQGQVCAASTIISLPSLIFGLLIKKFLIRGLTLGAVKE